MAKEDCPSCGTHIGPPTGYHGNDSMTMRSQRDCPNCGQALIWFVEGEGLPDGWTTDKATERRQRRAEG